MANLSKRNQKAAHEDDVLISLSLDNWKIDFSTAIIETMPHQYQREVDMKHVDNLIQDFAKNGIFGRNRGSLKGILLSDLQEDRTTVLKGARLHLFAGQHRGLATKKAFDEDKIRQNETIWTVSLYKEGMWPTWRSRCHPTIFGRPSQTLGSS